MKCELIVGFITVGIIFIVFIFEIIWYNGRRSRGFSELLEESRVEDVELMIVDNKMEELYPL